MPAPRRETRAHPASPNIRHPLKGSIMKHFFLAVSFAAALSGCAQMQQPQAEAGATAEQEARPYPTRVYQPNFLSW
jgi:hypothetical protein